MFIYKKHLSAYMKRKIIRLGRKDRASHLVSMPTSWLKKYNLKQGDEVDVDFLGNDIVVKASKGLAVPKEVTIDVTGFEYAYLWRLLNALYTSGVDVIRLKFEKDTIYDHRIHKEVKLLDVVRQHVQTCMGMEVEEIKKNSCVIRQFSTVIEEEFEHAFSKTYFIFLQMFENTVSLLKHYDTEKLSLMEMLDSDLDKFTKFCVRVCNKKGYKDYRRTFYVDDLLGRTESLGDLLDSICRWELKPKLKVHPKLVSVFESYLELYREFYKPFHKYKREDFLKYHKERSRLKDMFASFEAKNAYDATLLTMVKVVNIELGHMAEAHIQFGFIE